MAGGFKVGSGYLEVDVDYAGVNASIAAIEARLKAVRDVLIKVGIDADPAIASIERSLASLQMKALSIGGINQTELNTSLAEIQTKLDTLSKSANIDLHVTGITQAVGELAALSAAEDKATGTGGGGGGGGGFLGLTGAAFGFWGVLGALNRQIPLFGGLLSGIPLVRTVGGLHLAADAILEIAAVVIPAAIALGVFAAAASSTANDIYKSEQAFFTITTAFKSMGVTFPGVNSGLQTFTDSVKPQVYVLFGAALNTINQHTGLFQQLALSTGQVLDGLGARAQNALGGSGLTGLVSKGAQDVQLLGNIIGNVFGIFGNIMKNLPGYAQLLFGALQNVTGALEAITANSVVQGLLNIGLWFHGAVLWGGLAVTAIMQLQGPLMAVVGWAGGAINALVKFGVMFSIIAGEEGIMAAMTATLAGAWDALKASMLSNPFTWVAVAVGAVIGLVVWLGSMKSAAQQSLGAIDDMASKAPTLTQAAADLAQGLQQTNEQLATTPKYITQTVVGMHGMVSTITTLNPAWTGLTSNSQALTQQIGLQTSRMAQLNQMTGSAAQTQADLQSIGVKGLDIYKLSAGAYATVVTEIKDLITATIQLAGYQQQGGMAYAAQNALTNMYMNETLPAIQKITQAEDNIINVVIGGQAAFNNFQQSIEGTTAKFVSPSGLADAAKLAGGNLTGVNQQSLAFSNTLYTQSIPSLQKMIDALQQQSISQGDLTKVVATGAGQIVAYTGNNKEARTVMVDLINNALGPGTVTLKSLNQWIGTNSTSLSNMNGIVANSTTKVSGLADVLSTTLKNMQAVALFQAQGGQQAWNTFTTDVEKGTTNSQSFRTATQEVMAQLLIQSNNSLPAAQRAFVNYAEQGLGLTKQQADALWKQDLPGMQQEINSLHGKTVDVGVNVTGGGGITITASSPQIAASISGSIAKELRLATTFATGGIIKGHGGPKQDNVPILASVGEYVVQASSVDKYGKAFMDMINAGKFAAGGLVDQTAGRIMSQINTDETNVGSTSGSWSVTDGKSWTAAVATDWIQAISKSSAAAAAAQAAAVANVGSGVARWKGLVDQALRMEGLPLSLDSKVLYQMQTESGGNPNAINLTDINAQMGDPSRGLLQVIMSTFDMYHWPGTSNNIYDPLANIAAAINYARAVYGPTLSDQMGGMGSGHGYAVGGFLPAGQWGYVGEQGMEVAKARPGGGVDIVPLGNGGSGKQIVVNQNYYGTQFPTPEMTAHQRIDLALALGVAP
jgi:hypothetical protein